MILSSVSELSPQVARQRIKAIFAVTRPLELADVVDREDKAT
jgi:hypothetical protein